MLPFMTQPTVAPACYVPDYSLPGSLLLNRSAESHLNRVAVSATDSRKMTMFLAFQRTQLSQESMHLLGTGVSGTTFELFFDAADKLRGRMVFSSGSIAFTSDRCFRDVGGFLFILFGIDTTRPTPEQRYWLEVNGEPVALTAATYPGQDATLSYWNSAGTTLRIGAGGSSVAGTFLDGLLAGTHLLDGTALHSDRFVTRNIHGVAVLRDPALAVAEYGANGCHLDFSDPLIPGKDVSGKGNHFTAVNVDGTGKDTVASTPSNVYAAVQVLDKGSSVTVSGRSIAMPASSGRVRGSLCVDGMPAAYWEIDYNPKQWGASIGIGLIKPGAVTWNDVVVLLLDSANSGTLYNLNGSSPSSLSFKNGLASYTGRWCFAYRNGSLWMGTVQGGVCKWLGDGNPAAGTNPEVTGLADKGLFPGVYNGSPSQSAAVRFYFEPSEWLGEPPSADFLALCTDNLPEPDIKDPAEAFVQATGTGADIVAVLDAAAAHWNGQWVEIIKRRDASEDWRLRFSDDPGNSWATSNTSAKGAVAALAAGGTYVGYRLRVGARYGVYTAEIAHATGTATTVSHGLNTARNVVIATRVGAGGGSRYLRHPDMDAGKLMVMGSASPGCVGDASLTDFAANSFRIAASAPSGVYRVVVLAERHGLLSLTAYKGNGVADGAFVSADVLPHLAMIVETTTSGGVRVWDAARAPGNPVTVSSALTLAAMESVADTVDFVVGGVKLRSSVATLNGSGTKYLGIVWGRPVGGVCVAPATAR